MTDEKSGIGGSLTSGKSNVSTGNQGGVAATNSPGSSFEPVKSGERPRADPAATRSPPPLSETAWATRANELDPEIMRLEVTERSSYGASSAREEGFARRAKAAAFDSVRDAKNHAFDSISEGVGQIGDRTKRAGRGAIDFVGTHAIPLTLLGAGLGWLLVDMSSKRRAPQQSRATTGFDGEARDGARQRVGELADRATHALQEGRDRLLDRAHDVQAQVMGRVNELGSRAMEGASHAGERAASYGRQAYGAVARTGNNALKLSGDNPFMTGFLALLMGAATGLFLPATRRENRLLGSTRDHLLDTVQRSVSELKESAQHGVEELKSAVVPAHQPTT